MYFAPRPVNSLSLLSTRRFTQSQEGIEVLAASQLARLLVRANGASRYCSSTVYEWPEPQPALEVFWIFSSRRAGRDSHVLRGDGVGIDLAPRVVAPCVVEQAAAEDQHAGGAERRPDGGRLGSVRLCVPAVRRPRR